MKQLRIFFILLLIVSLVSGDKLYLSNGQVHEGKYIGMVEGQPTFIYSDGNTPIGLNPKDIIAITDNFGNVIITKEELLDLSSKIKKKQRRIIIIAAGVTLVGMVLFLSWWRSREGIFSYKTSE